MAKTKEMKMKCEGNCGMHLCTACAFPKIVFGVLFLVVGLGLVPNMTWLNGWTVLGAYVLLWGVVSVGMSSKK